MYVGRYGKLTKGTDSFVMTWWRWLLQLGHDTAHMQSVSLSVLYIYMHMHIFVNVGFYTGCVRRVGMPHKIFNSP